MWTNTAGVVDENEHTGACLNHIVPLVPLPNNEVFYKHIPFNPEVQQLNTNEHSVPVTSEPCTIQDGTCDATGPQCNHHAGIPSDSLYNPVIDLCK